MASLSHLLESLPVGVTDDDEDVAEALRRDAELESDPGSEISLEEIEFRLKRRRGADSGGFSSGRILDIERPLVFFGK